MWKQDLEALLKVWPDNRLIKKLEAVIGGIAITDTSDNHWFYDHNEGTLTQKGPWKKNHKEPKPKTDEEIEAEFEAKEQEYKDSLIYIRPVEGINYPYFSVEKDPEGGGKDCYGMDEEGLEALKQRVHGREIYWQNGWNVFAERELTVPEFNHLVKKYLDYIK